MKAGGYVCHSMMCTGNIIQSDVQLHLSDILPKQGIVEQKSGYFQLYGWLVVLNIPSTARSVRDGTPINCPLRRT